MYNNNLLSDVTVKFSGQKVVAHKAILALKSEYFRRAFAGKFLVCLQAMSGKWLYQKSCANAHVGRN